MKASASLVEQGAGMLNIDGALRLAEAFKTDAASKLAAGAWPIGAKISAGTLPAPSSTINGQTFNWSRMVTYWPKTGVSASYTVPSSFSETSAPNGSLLTGGVRPATALAGISSKSGSTGDFLPSATMAGWLASGSGSGLALVLPPSRAGTVRGACPLRV